MAELSPGGAQQPIWTSNTRSTPQQRAPRQRARAVAAALQAVRGDEIEDKRQAIFDDITGLRADQTFLRTYLGVAQETAAAAGAAAAASAAQVDQAECLRLDLERQLHDARVQLAAKRAALGTSRARCGALEEDLRRLQGHWGQRLAALKSELVQEERLSERALENVIALDRSLQCEGEEFSTVSRSCTEAAARHLQAEAQKRNLTEELAERERLAQRAMQEVRLLEEVRDAREVMLAQEQERRHLAQRYAKGVRRPESILWEQQRAS